MTANLLTEVRHEVQVEPTLQPISGEQFCQASLNTEERARLDIFICVVFGVAVVRKPTLMLNFLTPMHLSTNCLSNPPAIYRRHEKMKKHSYEDRIHEVEHSSFTPLIFSATGVMAHEAHKRLASLLSERWTN